MANILCNWVVEERGCILYDYDTGDELTNFIDNDFSGDELGDTFIVHWNGVNICYEFPNYPDESLKIKCYRVIRDLQGKSKTVK